jgi:hypothetical protein
MKFGELVMQIAPRFDRVEPRRRVAAFLQGLLAGLQRINQLLDDRRTPPGHDPCGMQRLLLTAALDRTAWCGRIQPALAATRGTVN